MNGNKNDYYSIFISSIIINCASYAPGCQNNDIIYPSILMSLQMFSSGGKKNGFVLDCTNKEKSTKKHN